MEFEPEPSYWQMESYLVFQVSTSSVLKWKLLEYPWIFYLGILISSHHHVSFCTFFPDRKNDEFPSSESSNHHWWTQDSRIGAHKSDEQEPLRREGATNPAKVGFPSKNGGDFLMGFLMGWDVWRGKSDGKLGPFGYFVLEKKGKIAIRKECWKHYCQL